MLFVTRPRAYVVVTTAFSRKQYEATELSCQSTDVVEADVSVNKDRLLRLIFLAGDVFR